eukprot:m.791127 g.791127  ORF g.791127 m.791127 type:complete len:120 (+) comp23330_c1_seq6:3336-3695(+)
MGVEMALKPCDCHRSTSTSTHPVVTKDSHSNEITILMEPRGTYGPLLQRLSRARPGGGSLVVSRVETQQYTMRGNCQGAIHGWCVCNRFEQQIFCAASTAFRSNCGLLLQYVLKINCST